MPISSAFDARCVVNREIGQGRTEYQDEDRQRGDGILARQRRVGTAPASTCATTSRYTSRRCRSDDLHEHVVDLLRNDRERAVFVGRARDRIAEMREPPPIEPERQFADPFVRTSGSTTVSSMTDRSSTCTLQKSNDERTSAPEMMQQFATIESHAAPLRPGPSSTNFAGGSCSWYVQIGQSSS